MMVAWLREHKVLTVFIFAALVLLSIYFLVFSSRDRGVLLSRQHTFVYDEIERSYLLSAPKQVSDESKIIIGLHGFGDSPRRFAYYTGLHNAVGAGDVVIYPSAVSPRSDQEKTGWNASFCCGSGWINKVDDVGFIVALIDKVATDLSISTDRVYVTGFSNGAFMAQRLAVDYPDRFKAVAAVSGSAGTTTEKLQPKEPIPILLMHGEQDTIVPYDGGVGSSDPDFTWITFSETTEIWKTLNADAANTKVIIYPDDGHTWHNWRILNSWNHSPKASEEIIQYFDSH